MNDDERFMTRAIDLARRAPFTSPNPRVGAVLVRGGRIIGEGAHGGPGTAHAEVLALEGADARGATLYVNLEPCVHQGRTPPCAPALVRSGIARIVVAIEDADERARGSGLRYLRSNGVRITTGVLAEEARRLNAPYVHHRTTGRPFVTLKLALTLDGRLGARDGSSRWITGEEARRRVHARRREADAVMVGAGTVIADDPQLTVRDAPVTRQPTRVVVDATGRVPSDARALDADGGVEVIVATTHAAPHEVQVSWKERGADVLILPASDAGVDLSALLDRLGRAGFVEIYCEGGARLATSLLRDRLVQRLELHYGATLVGTGGPALGDVGVRTMGEAERWRRVDVHAAGDDIIATFEAQPAGRRLDEEEP